MTVDATLATYSDWCYAGAVVVYFLALVLHAVHVATVRSRAADRVLVTAGATADAADATATDGATPSRDEITATDGATAGRGERAGRMAVALTVLGALVHAASLLLRGLAVHRVPWGNMYEFGSAICLAAVLTWLVLLRRHGGSGVQRLGVFVLLPIVLLLFLSGTVLYTQAAPLVPALRSYWITIHVSAAIIASGMLLVAGAASVGYLLRVNGRGERLPAAGVLDRLAYRATIAAFPVWTFAIIAGAIWAETAWGRYWGWDPKETVALVAWVVYAGYLHARATAGWRTGAAWVNVAGLAVMIFNLFFVNLVVSGFHSYAGVG